MPRITFIGPQAGNLSAEWLPAVRFISADRFPAYSPIRALWQPGARAIMLLLPTA